MIDKIINGTIDARRAILIPVLAIVVNAPSVGYAEDCIITATTKAVPDFTPCNSTQAPIDVDSAQSDYQASPARVPSTTGTPWIASSGGGLPATVSASGESVSMRTSFGTWRNYNSRAASPTLDGMATTPSDVTLPKPPPERDAPLDVWSNIDVQGYEGSRDQSVRAGVGANLSVSRATIIGVSAERGDARSDSAPVAEQDSKMSAFVTLKAAPMLSLRARSDWQSGNAEFAAAQGAANKNSISLSPRLDHAFAIDGGHTIEPFVSYTHQFDMSTTAREADAATQSAGAGVKYSAPDAYSLSLTTDLQGIGAKDAESMSSKIQLSVPIK